MSNAGVCKRADGRRGTDQRGREPHHLRASHERRGHVLGLQLLWQLGDGTQTNRLTPVDVSGLTSGVTQVSAGSNHTCAQLTDGGLKCWGYNTC